MAAALPTDMPTAVMPAAERSARVAKVFDRAAPTYDAVGVPWFGLIAAHLVAALAPEPGERVLDVGCGRGAALFPLAEAVGPTGRVSGIDLAPAMIELTRADAVRRGLPVDLAVMDASAPTLPEASFDVVASSLVLFFLPDPAAALRCWVSLLAPGGRLGVSTFASRDQAMIDLDDVFTPYLPPMMLDARASGSRGPFASDEGMSELLRQAGLQAVTTTQAPVRAVFDDAAHWLRFSWSHGQRAMWEAVPEVERPAVAERATRLIDRVPRVDGKVVFEQQVRITTGTC